MASVNVRVIVDVNAEFRVGVRRHTPRVIAIRQSQTSIVLRHSQRRGPRSQVRSHRSKSESDVRRFMPASEVTGIHTTQMYHPRPVSKPLPTSVPFEHINCKADVRASVRLAASQVARPSQASGLYVKADVRSYVTAIRHNKTPSSYVRVIRQCHAPTSQPASRQRHSRRQSQRRAPVFRRQC